MNITSALQDRILVVDDTALVRHIHRKLFADAGYAVDEASNGKEAVAMYDHHYAAILMDVNMDVMDGITATAEIRRKEQNGQHIPIIGISSQEDKKENCLAAGMDDFALKPLLATQVRELAEKWIKM